MCVARGLIIFSCSPLHFLAFCCLFLFPSCCSFFLLSLYLCMAHVMWAIHTTRKPVSEQLSNIGLTCFQWHKAQFHKAQFPKSIRIANKKFGHLNLCCLCFVAWSGIWDIQEDTTRSAYSKCTVRPLLLTARRDPAYKTWVCKLKIPAQCSIIAKSNSKKQNRARDEIALDAIKQSRELWLVDDTKKWACFYLHGCKTYLFSLLDEYFGWVRRARNKRIYIWLVL